ncbi:MAG: hypothetical protein M0026_00290 [Nocardiopsaceae bacterium]|nr:hypothetical protein [Nocardiopsaceae bacterium]
MTESFNRREVAFLHDGAFYQLASIEDLLSEGYPIRPVYLPDLLEGRESLDGVERLLVADRLHPRLWASAGPACVDVARRGGTVFLSGENSLEAVPGFTLTPTATNFWWWVSGEDPGIVINDSSDPLQQYLTPRAQRWHFHGVLHTPPHAAILTEHRDQGPEWSAGALLAVDRQTTAGVLAVTTMDPVYHHGSRFMPGASLLLRGAVEWLAADASPDAPDHGTSTPNTARG